MGGEAHFLSPGGEPIGRRAGVGAAFLIFGHHRIGSPRVMRSHETIGTQFLSGNKKDGVAASKNWQAARLTVSTKWNVNIPKKNRHSESVNQARPGQASGGTGASAALGIRAPM